MLGEEELLRPPIGRQSIFPSVPQDNISAWKSKLSADWGGVEGPCGVIA